MDCTENNLANLLAASTLTPGTYTPSQNVKTAVHAAVFAGDSLIALTGPADDLESVSQAKALAHSPVFRRLVQLRGHSAPLVFTRINGAEITWPERCAAVVSKPAGQVEHGGEDGPLMTIVFDGESEALSTAMCVIAEVAQIIDPEAPLLAGNDDFSSLNICKLH